MLRSLALPALLALTGAAYAQAGDAQMLKEKDAAEAKDIHRFIDRLETDQKYQETIKSQASAPVSRDPWGNVRPVTTTPAKPAAKPTSIVKSANSANKAAVKSTTSATSASGASGTPRNQ
jgi:hypothetical protein